jgi:hypothetical protein
MPGARCTRSLAWEKIEPHERSHREVHRIHPAFPHAMVLTVYPVIFPVIGLCCHRHWRDTSRQLDASVEASEPHDFAVRPSAVRQQHVSVHRIPPRVRDDRDRPSMGRDGGAYGFDLGQSRTNLFLQMGVDRPNQVDPLEQISVLRKLPGCDPGAPHAVRLARSGQDSFPTSRYNPSTRKIEECP